MGKISEFAKKHKVAIWTGVATVIGFVGGWLLNSAQGMTDNEEKVVEKKPQITIDPDYYDTFDEAVVAFKELQKTTDHAVLVDSYGVSYGVFDEAELLGEPKK
jgi:hypothetical protein